MARKVRISIDLRLLSVFLGLVIIVMLGLWQPWADKGPIRKITVAGQARLVAEPDSYMFHPYYQQTDADKQVAIQALNTKVSQITDKLKELGVEDKDITLQSNAYEAYYRDPGTNAVTAYLSVKVNSKELAQKVQDYLLTTGPSGSISPSPSFSDEKKKGLEAEARDKALADARTQAERSAKQEGLKVGKVLEVKDINSGGIFLPMGSGVAEDSVSSSDRSSSLPIFPGEQEVSFTLEVTFELK